MKKNVIIVFAIVLVLGLIGYFTFFKPKTKNNLNSNNSSNVSIDDNYRDRIYSVLGLTNEGYKRSKGEECLNCTEEEKAKLDSKEYILFNEQSLANFFISLEEKKEIVIKELPKEKIKQLLYIYAKTNGLIDLDVLVDEGEDETLNKYSCIENSGACDGISLANYGKIARIYDLSDNPSDYFDQNERYKQYCLFETDGANDIIAEIKDSINIEPKDEELVITYDIDAKLKNDNNTNIKKKLTFKFKKKNETSYYVYSVTVNK